MEIQVKKFALINLGDEVFVRFSLFENKDEVSFDYPKGLLVEIAEGGRSDNFSEKKLIETMTVPIDRSFDHIKQLMPFYDLVKALLSENIGGWTMDANQACVNLVAHWTLGEHEIKQALSQFSKDYHAFIQNKE